MSERPDAQQARPDLYRSEAVRGQDCVLMDDLAAPFVLSALDATDRRRVERHRAQCPSCDALITSLQAPIDLLGVSVRQVAPPTHAKMALFEKIATTPQIPAVQRQTRLTIETPVTVPTLTIPSSRDAFAPTAPDWRSTGPGPSPAGRRGRFRPSWQAIATPLATVPLVLALGIVGVWAMNTQDRLSARSAEVQSLNQQVISLSDRVSALNSTISDVDGFMQSADAKTYDMTTANATSNPDAVGMVIANPGTADAMLVVKGLDSRHSLYQVVVESEDGVLTSVGEIPVAENGSGKAVLKLTQPFSNYRSVHVKPITSESGNSSVDTGALTAPDALTGTIDQTLGSDGDTNVPDAGQSG